MSKRLNPAEMMKEVRSCLTREYWNMSFTLNSWFFPGDLGGSRFKYKCRKLHKLGLLERKGMASDRWGYFYHIPSQQQRSREL